MAEGPFKAKKDNKFMPVAGTYSIVNYVREGLRGPFKAKNVLPAAGTVVHTLLFTERGGSFKAKNFLPAAACGCLWQALTLL